MEVPSALTGRVVIPMMFRNMQVYSPVTLTSMVLSPITWAVPRNRDAATYFSAACFAMSGLGFRCPFVSFRRLIHRGVLVFLS